MEISRSSIPHTTQEEEYANHQGVSNIRESKAIHEGEDVDDNEDDEGTDLANFNGQGMVHEMHRTSSANDLNIHLSVAHSASSTGNQYAQQIQLQRQIMHHQPHQMIHHPSANNQNKVSLKNLIGRIFLNEKEMLETLAKIFPKGVKVCRKDKWKNGPHAGLHKKWRFVCECSGQPKLVGGMTQQTRKSKKIGCPFYINAFWSKDVSGPRITTANFYHFGHDGNDMPVYHFSEDDTTQDTLLSQYETYEKSLVTEDVNRQQMQKEMLMISLKSKLISHLTYMFSNFPLEGIVKKVHDFLSPETNPPNMFPQPIPLTSSAHHTSGNTANTSHTHTHNQHMSNNATTTTNHHHHPHHSGGGSSSNHSNNGPGSNMNNNSSSVRMSSSTAAALLASNPHTIINNPSPNYHNIPPHILNHHLMSQQQQQQQQAVNSNSGHNSVMSNNQIMSSNNGPQGSNNGHYLSHAHSSANHHPSQLRSQLLQHQQQHLLSHPPLSHLNTHAAHSLLLSSQSHHMHPSQHQQSNHPPPPYHLSHHTSSNSLSHHLPPYSSHPHNLPPPTSAGLSIPIHHPSHPSHSSMMHTSPPPPLLPSLEYDNDNIPNFYTPSAYNTTPRTHPSLNMPSNVNTNSSTPTSGMHPSHHSKTSNSSAFLKPPSTITSHLSEQNNHTSQENLLAAAAVAALTSSTGMSGGGHSGHNISHSGGSTGALNSYPESDYAQYNTTSHVRSHSNPHLSHHNSMYGHNLPPHSVRMLPRADDLSSTYLGQKRKSPPSTDGDDDEDEYDDDEDNNCNEQERDHDIDLRPMREQHYTQQQQQQHQQQSHHLEPQVSIPLHRNPLSHMTHHQDLIMNTHLNEHHLYKDYETENQETDPTSSTYPTSTTATTTATNVTNMESMLTESHSSAYHPPHATNTHMEIQPFPYRDNNDNNVPDDDEYHDHNIHIQAVMNQENTIGLSDSAEKEDSVPNTEYREQNIHPEESQETQQ